MIETEYSTSGPGGNSHARRGASRNVKSAPASHSSLASRPGGGLDAAALHTLRHWLTAIALFGSLWLLGWLVWAPRIERKLQAAAESAIAQNSEAAFLKHLSVSFDGRRAVLSGLVTKERRRNLAAAIVSEQVRTGGLASRLNPVSAVRDEIKVEPLPPGGVMLALAGHKISLAGIVATDDERAAVSREVQMLLSKPGTEFSSQIIVDDERTSEGGNPAATLSSLPSQIRQHGEVAGVFFARLGGGWQYLHPASLLAVRQKAQSLAWTDEEWEAGLLPLAKEAAAFHEKQKLAAEETARLAKLPPAHIIAALAGNRVLLRGELSSAGLKTQIVAAALRQYEGRQVIDEIRVTANRRPVADASEVLGAMPQPPAGSWLKFAAVIVPGHAWNIANVAGSNPSSAIAAAMPEGFDPQLAESDAKAAAAWLADSVPAAVALERPHLALAVFSDRVWLRGQVAEESSRSQLLNAARRAYPGRLLVHFVRLNARCLPVESVQQTALSFPAAPANEAPGIMAVAVPGEVWKQADASESLFTTDGLVKAGIVPDDIPADVLLEEFGEAIDALKPHLERLRKTQAR